MKATENKQQQLITVPNPEMLKGIENHKKTATHLREAEKNTWKLQSTMQMEIIKKQLKVQLWRKVILF